MGMINKKLLYIYTALLIVGIATFTINPYPIILEAFSFIIFPIIAGYLVQILYRKKPSRRKLSIIISYEILIFYSIIFIGAILKIKNSYYELLFIIFCFILFVIIMVVYY